MLYYYFLDRAVKLYHSFQGEPLGPILTDETIWTLEDKKVVEISLTKANLKKGEAWNSLLKNQYVPDAETLHEMRKKIDLEMFQIEVRIVEPAWIIFFRRKKVHDFTKNFRSFFQNPGMDFSRAKLSKKYDAKYSNMTEKELSGSQG